MNWLDIVLLILVAGSVASAFAKGVSRELIGFTSVLIALGLGTWFYGSAAYYLLPYLKSRSLANLVGFLVIFGGILLLGLMVAKTVRRLIKVAGLSFFDRLLGAAFGFLRGVVIAIAILMATMAFAPGDHPPQAIVDSRLSPYFMQAARACASMAPYELREGFRNSYDEIKAIWNTALRKGIQALPSKKKKEKE